MKVMAEVQLAVEPYPASPGPTGEDMRVKRRLSTCYCCCLPGSKTQMFEVGCSLRMSTNTAPEWSCRKGFVGQTMPPVQCKDGHAAVRATRVRWVVQAPRVRGSGANPALGRVARTNPLLPSSETSLPAHGHDTKEGNLPFSTSKTCILNPKDGTKPWILKMCGARGVHTQMVHSTLSPPLAALTTDRGLTAPEAHIPFDLSYLEGGQLDRFAGGKR